MCVCVCVWGGTTTSRALNHIFKHNAVNSKEQKQNEKKKVTTTATTPAPDTTTHKRKKGMIEPW